jgi:hypothetical protein
MHNSIWLFSIIILVRFTRTIDARGSRCIVTSRSWLWRKNERTKRAGKPSTSCGGLDQMHAHIGLCRQYTNFPASWVGILEELWISMWLNELPQSFMPVRVTFVVLQVPSNQNKWSNLSIIQREYIWCMA